MIDVCFGCALTVILLELIVNVALYPWHMSYVAVQTNWVLGPLQSIFARVLTLVSL